MKPRHLLRMLFLVLAQLILSVDFGSALDRHRDAYVVSLDNSACSWNATDLSTTLCRLAGVCLANLLVVYHVILKLVEYDFGGEL